MDVPDAFGSARPTSVLASRMQYRGRGQLACRNGQKEVTPPPISRSARRGRRRRAFRRRRFFAGSSWRNCTRRPCTSGQLALTGFLGLDRWVPCQVHFGFLGPSSCLLRLGPLFLMTCRWRRWLSAIRRTGPRRSASASRTYSAIVNFQPAQGNCAIEARRVFRRRRFVAEQERAVDGLDRRDDR
jgi:hypothetical protein